MPRRADPALIIADGDLKRGEPSKQTAPVVVDRPVVVHELGERIGQGSNPGLEIRPLRQSVGREPFGQSRAVPPHHSVAALQERRDQLALD